MIKRGLNSKLAEVGKIKIGRKAEKVTKTKNGKEFQMPEKLDYFLITTTERDASKNLIINHEIMDRLPKDKNGKIRELRIRLPFDSVDKNFFTQYQYYAGRHRVCSVDGVEAERIFRQAGKQVLPFEDGDKEIEVKQGEVKKIKCDPSTCIFSTSGKCKVSGILSTFLPDAKDLGGIYKFRTHSYNSVASIDGSLKYYAEQTGGVLQHMPLKLVMIKKTTEDHGNIDYVTVVVDGDKIYGLRKAAMEEVQSRKMLGVNITALEEQAERSGFFRDTDPEDVVQEEFYPENETEEISEPVNVTPKNQAEEIKQKLDEPKKTEEKPVGQRTTGDEELF